ncbi:hypothetical protein ACFE04_002899 [Oxalis oulophora]
MSFSTDTLPNLFCNEALDDVVFSSSDADIGQVVDPVALDDSAECCIAFLLDSETETEQLRKLDEHISTGRLETVKWMFKVHGYYQMRPETAYLSVKYLDGFLSSHMLPKGKAWPLQLLAVACLSLAAKMEEIYVPTFLNLQILEPKYLFKPKTVQQMEVLVMARLKWRLRVITPFDFAHYFITKLTCSASQYELFFARASRIILSTCHVMDYLDYTPSAIAAAAVIFAANQFVNDQNISCFHKSLNHANVKKCHNLVKKCMSHSADIDQN